MIETDEREDDMAAGARRIVDEIAYMTLATADGDGTPWATPVWFAHEGYRDFVWISSPEAGHSRNIRVRPDVGIAIFDSRVPIGTGRGVYLAARAEEVKEDDVDPGIAVFTVRSTAQGGAAWSREDVVAPARHRLYRARVTAAFVNDRRDRRAPIALAPGD